MGSVAYSVDCLVPADIMYQHIADRTFAVRHYEVMERALRVPIPRDYQVLKQRENEYIEIKQGSFTYGYEFIATDTGCAVSFRVAWGGWYNLILGRGAKRRMLAILLTDIQACEHTAYLMLKRSKQN